MKAQTPHVCSVPDIDAILRDIESPDETVRASAVRLLCPCRSGWEPFKEHLPLNPAAPKSRRNHDINIFGIVSNGQAWQFYKLTLAGEIFETDLYVTSDLPELLGALDYVCAECAKNAP